MSVPVGNAAIVTRDDALLRALQEQALLVSHRQVAPAKAALKTQAEVCTEKCHSLNDQMKDISKQAVSSSIDTCIDWTIQGTVDAVFKYLKPSGS